MGGPSMLKRIFLALSIVAGLIGPVQSAGTIPLSMTQQLDSSGTPLNGGLLYFYAAGTTTPQSAYQDSDLTIPWPNPITLDSAGRVPQLFFADGSIKIRLTNAAGVTQLAADGILVIGASSGGGGGSPVDATTILTTGDIKLRHGTGNLTGFVRVNGRTIGSATSGATERANADCQALFEYLWTADANMTVSGGRGASANADWVANKTITLPNARGHALAGLDDMGATQDGIFSGASFTFGTATTLGAKIGASRRSLVASNLPPYTPSGTISNGAITLSFNTSPIIVGTSTNGTVNSGGEFSVPANISSLTASASQAASSFTGAAQGGTSAAFDTISPFMLITIYMKL